MVHGIELTSDALLCCLYIPALRPPSSLTAVFMARSEQLSSKIRINM